MNENETNRRIERLTEQCERLAQENAELRAEREGLLALLADADAESERLLGLVDTSAEDLQLFGANWFVPSSVTTITSSSSGIHINGHPLGLEFHEGIAAEMREHAERINALKRQKREQARSRQPRP